jgi:uncharacterized membrane protein YfcA
LTSTELWHIPVLVAAGVGAGLSASVAGLASLVSYPALLAVGLTPISANVTNTVALVFNGLGYVSASGPELEGQWRHLRWSAIAGLLGGLCGAGLLLETPSDSFKRIVPWLIGLASILVLTGPRLVPADRSDRDQLHIPTGTGFAAFFIAIYGGYFGAAAGVAMIVLLQATVAAPFPRLNAIKNLVLTLSNLVAAIVFIVASSVQWQSCIPLAAGLFLGGRMGPAVVRALPAAAIRVAICVLGLGLAVWLGIEAYE